MLEYKPLKDGEFRLLQIQPLSHLRNDLAALSLDTVSIQCTLVTVARKNAPPYRTLSYTWGDDKDLSPISVNDDVCLVTRNLFHALENIRDENKVITIWNDAICINQNDGPEKSEQVRQMTSIYSSTFETVAWVGLAADGSDEFLKRCNEIASELWKLKFTRGEGETTGFLELINEFGFSQSASKTQKNGHSYLDQPVLDVLEGLFEKDAKDVKGTVEFFTAYKDFVRRTYWNRVWVRQEFVVSPELFIQCGKSVIRFQQFRAVLFYIQLMPIQLIFKLMKRADTIYNNATQDIQLKLARWVIDGYAGEEFDEDSEEPSMKEYKQLWRYHFKIASQPSIPSLGVLGLRNLYHSPRQDLKQNRFTLWRMLAGIHVENTVGITRDRDRIFAFLSMATDKDQLGIETTYDERISDNEIFREAALKIIAVGHVDLLSFAQHRLDIEQNENSKKEETLPSWVPDWRHLIFRPCGQLPWETTFNASAEEEFHPAIESVTSQQDQNALILSGWIIDTIEDVATPWRPPTENFASADNYPKIAQFLEDTRNLCELSDAKFHATGTDVYITDPAKERESAYFIVPAADQERYSLTTIGRATEESKQSHAKVLEGITRGALSTESADYVCMMSYQKFRRPFISDQGYVGLAPDIAEKGDVIVIFRGAKFPYVLRKRKDGDRSFRLVGEAYVNGIMYGEFLREKRKEREFILL